jgi:alpha-tubulin suppressor-like RCC1 family protein
MDAGGKWWWLMLRSGGMRMVLAVAGMAVVAGAGTAASAVAAAAPGAYAFGYNPWGELGDGTRAEQVLPVPVSGLPGTVRQLSAGAATSAALLSDGTVWTWGDNTFGALGNGTSGGSVSTPQRVAGLSGITQIAVGTGDRDIYAVRSDGSLWAWGDNGAGELGNGTTVSHFNPIQVPGLTGISQMSAGPDYALALRSDGTVRAWGNNSNGYLGDGTTTSRLAPVQVRGLTGISQVSASGASFAVRSDGTLFAWGLNADGVLGMQGGFFVTPAAVPGLSGVRKVASNGTATLAVVGIGGRVWAWGDNTHGVLGDGSTTSRLNPEPLGLSGITQVAVSIGWNSAAVRSDGTLWTWGDNSDGELGIGNDSTLWIPVPVQVTALAAVSQVSVGVRDVLAIGSPTFAFVPDLSGDTTARATQALQAAGLVLGTVRSVVDNSCNDIGTVMSQNPVAGTRVSLGSPVSITIGTRPPRPCP